MTINEIGARCLGWEMPADCWMEKTHDGYNVPHLDPPDVDIQGEPTDEQIVNVQRLVDKATTTDANEYFRRLKMRSTDHLIREGKILEAVVAVHSLYSSLQRNAAFDVLAEGEAKEAWESLK